MLERATISRHLKKKFACLEIGCGDGAHSIVYAAKVKHLQCLELADCLAQIAQSKFETEGINNINIVTGSALDLDEIFGGCLFDCIISQRCLINLSAWKHQKAAIKKIYHLLGPKGLFILAEGFKEELGNLNHARMRFSLPEIKVVSYNRYFSRVRFEDYIRRYFEIINVDHYGQYLFLSRLFHPLAVQPDQPQHDSILNRVAMEITQTLADPGMDQYSYHSTYILRKKDL